jgi:capsular exopolysaccharide synthesis family protein
MSRIDLALKRAAEQAESAVGLSEFTPIAVAELTFSECDAIPEFAPVRPPVPGVGCAGSQDATAVLPTPDMLIPDLPEFDPLPLAGPEAREAWSQDLLPDAPEPASGHGQGAGAVLPDSGAVLPDSGAVLPDNGAVLPDSGAVLPDKGAGLPDSGAVLPDNGAVLPGALFQGFAADVREKLVVGDNAGKENASAVAIEQFRRLAATLHHAQVEREIRVVLITSAIAGEGKTLTAANLALTLSESYRRNVLLIDADLRRPGLHQIFQLPNTSGLREGLSEEGDGKLPLMEITPHLMVLPAGRPDPDPMSLLTSSRMRRIIEEASARFDWVIVDSPPVALITDAGLLAKMVDATLLVVQAGRTDYPIVRRAVEAIGRERILGVVLNRITLPDSPYGYKYDRYYAPYRSGPGRKGELAK